MYGYGNSMFLATHGILARSASGGGVDPDAQAFITAAAITNPTQQSAINTLVVSLKGYNIWTKFKAIYPIVGGSASSHAVNLKTPGTFNLSFQVGWTHSATGMVPLGATFANTNFNDNILTLDSAHISIYSRTNINGLYSDIGAIGATNRETNMFARYTDLTYARVQALTNNTVANTDSRGLFISNRISSTIVKSIKNTTINNISSTSIGNTNFNIYLGALNSSGTATFNSVRELAFASIGDGLTDTDAANFYTAVQAYQTTLSRQV